LRESEDFSFISVNMDGTTANVEVRERRKGSVLNNENLPSNIVARYDGIIDRTMVYSGKSVVPSGAKVREGDILVTGILEKKEGFDLVRSNANIYAHITRSFTVEVPFEYAEKVFTGEEKKDIRVSFFGKKFDVYTSNLSDFGVYEAFNDRERLVLFDAVRLPFLIETTVYKEFCTESRIYTREQAKAEAEIRMSKLLADELSTADILERRSSGEWTEAGYRLTCEIYCIDDIALEKIIDNSTAKDK